MYDNQNVFEGTNGASVVMQLKVFLVSSVFRLFSWLRKRGGLSQVVLVQLRKERLVARLRKHTLLLQDGEDTHGLQRRKKDLTVRVI